MSVELRPLGVACNLACTYCYQEPMREAGNTGAGKYDVDKMLAEAEKTGQPFHLFGGEALLVKKSDLIRFFERGYELHGTNGVQTNGTLIDDEHIEIFKKYNVHVGVSVDGANDLNGLRKVRNKRKRNDDNATLEATNKTVDNIRKLVREGVSVSVIITLHRLNGTGDNLDRLINFVRWLGDTGIKSGNMHTLEVDKTMPDQEIHVLTQEENAESFIKLAKFFAEEENSDLSWNPFNDYYDAIVKEDFSHLTCTLNRCDPMNTQAVYGIEGDGGLSNCGRTNKEGIDWYKADDIGYERYISLYNTPDELGGCQGCPFFMLCSGSCNGEAIDDDFRNKSIHCHTYKEMYHFYEGVAEEEGITPWTKRKDRKYLEKAFLEDMISGTHTNVSRVKDKTANMTVQVNVKEGR